MIKTYSRRGIYTMVSSGTSTSRYALVVGLFFHYIRSLLGLVYLYVVSFAST